MKKIIILMMLMFAVLSFNSYAATSCVLNSPISLTYNNGQITLNTSFNKGAMENATNVSWTFTSGSTTFIFKNDTLNGSGGASDTIRHFTYILTDANLTDNLAYSVTTTCSNNSLNSGSTSQTTSAAITYTVDVIPPSVVIQVPLSGSIVIPNSGNAITFEYTPIDANLGNCSFNLDNQLVKSSTSGNTASNVTTGIINRFTHPFIADNSSVRLAINCRDLAGLQSSSTALNNYTFGVLRGGSSYALRQAQAAASGNIQQVQQQQGFTAVSTNPTISEAQNHLQKYLWLYFIGGIGFIALIFRKKIFK